MGSITTAVDALQLTGQGHKQVFFSLLCYSKPNLGGFSKGEYRVLKMCKSQMFGVLFFLLRSLDLEHTLPIWLTAVTRGCKRTPTGACIKRTDPDLEDPASAAAIGCPRDVSSLNPCSYTSHCEGLPCISIPSRATFPEWWEAQRGLSLNRTGILN